MEWKPNPNKTKKKNISNHASTNCQKKQPLPPFSSFPLSHHHINPFHFHYHFQPFKNKNPRIHFSNLHTKNNLCLGIYLVNLVQILFLIIMRGKKTHHSGCLYLLPIHLSSLSTWPMVGLDFLSAKSIQSQSLETQLLIYNISFSTTLLMVGFIFLFLGGREGGREAWQSDATFSGCEARIEKRNKNDARCKIEG